MIYEGKGRKMLYIIEKRAGEHEDWKPALLSAFTEEQLQDAKRYAAAINKSGDKFEYGVFGYTLTTREL